MKKRVSVETVNEVNKFVADTVRELSAKYNVKKPLVVIGRFGCQYVPYEEGRLCVSNRFYPFWEIDKEKAKKVVKWSVAHEFGHHLQYLRGALPSLFDIHLMFNPKLESEANELAESYTNVPASEYSAIVDELSKIMKKEYVKKLPELEATEV